MTLSPTLLALPVAIPLAFAALAAIFQVLKAAHYVRVQQVLALIAVISNFIVALVILVETLSADPLFTRWACGRRPLASPSTPTR